VPLALSVIPPMLPKVVERVTVVPPAIRLLPFASFACTVMADADTPLATIEVGVAEMVEVVTLACPGVSVTAGEVVVMATPLMWPVMVAMPAAVEEVKVAL
jgi:hypothetical protein